MVTWRQLRWWLLGAALFALLALFSYGAFMLMRGALHVRVSAEKAGDALNTADFPGLHAALLDAQGGLTDLEKGFAAFRVFDLVPYIRDQRQGAVYAVRAGRETLGVLVSATDVLADVTSTLVEGDASVDGLPELHDIRAYNSLTREEKARVLQAFARSLPDLRKMEAKLTLAESDLAELKKLDLHPAFADLLSPLEQGVGALRQAIEVAIPFAGSIPEFAGLGQDRQFLVLYLNNSELRPGGGFIGYYALLQMRDGEIKNLKSEDSYVPDAYVQFDPNYRSPLPNQVLRRELGIFEWYFRDAAWSPDFPTTAEYATALLRQEYAHGGQPVPEVNGVIGLTPTFVADLLRVTGPLDVAGEKVDANNVYDLLQYETQQGFAEAGKPPDSRKELVGQVTEALVNRLLSLPLASWPTLFSVLEDGFGEKQLALVSQEKSVQDVLHDAKWSAEIARLPREDAFMLVDANLAGLKTDPVVERAVTYALVPHGQTFRATATITYTHKGTFDYKTSRYRSYSQVYVPKGATLVSASGILAGDLLQNPQGLPGEVFTGEEGDFTTFGGFIAVEPGASHTLTFVYDLPADVAAAIHDGVYDLKLFKQMGAGDNLLTLDANFDRTLIRAVPSEEREDFGDKAYRLKIGLTKDTHVHLELER